VRLDTSASSALLPTARTNRNLSGIAIVGLGYWGPNWVRNLSQLKCADRIVCCDLNQERRDSIARLYPGVETTAALDDVLDDPEIEAAVVATPISTHYPIGRKLLDAGKAVLIEKPLATSAEESLALFEHARREGLTLMVGHTFEYSAPVLKIRELIDAGELGDIFYISSTRANLGLFQRDVNVVWDLATHDVSITLKLMGQMPHAVACQGQSHCRTDIEDVALLTLYFDNHQIAFIHVSWLDPNKIRRTTVVGSRKMLVYDDTALQEKIRVYDKGVTVLPRYDTFGDFQLSYRYGDIHIPRIEEVEPLRLECEHFVDCIRSGAQPSTDGLSGWRVVSVLEAANQSLKLGGRPVGLNADGTVRNDH
jgi:predicted dehydrogenase